MTGAAGEQRLPKVASRAFWVKSQSASSKPSDLAARTICSLKYPDSKGSDFMNLGKILVWGVFGCRGEGGKVANSLMDLVHGGDAFVFGEAGGALLATAIEFSKILVDMRQESATRWC